MMWWQFAQARGMSDERALALVQSVDDEIAKIGGVGFATTPMLFQSALSNHLSFESPGGVWVKDETHNVGGSQKARHLMSILLHLLVAEDLGIAPWANSVSRPTLAISSCGNAAIAASTLAAAAKWPIDVFIPEWAGGVARSVATGVQVTARLPDALLSRSDPTWDLNFDPVNMSMISNRTWSADDLTAMRAELNERVAKRGGEGGEYWWSFWK